MLMMMIILVVIDVVNFTIVTEVCCHYEYSKYSEGSSWCYYLAMIVICIIIRTLLLVTALIKFQDYYNS